MKYLGFALFFFFIMIFLGQSGILAQQKLQEGKATYYGKRFNNRKTASGRIYRGVDMVCAHRTYPFGTRLLVKNLKNGKKVIVEVIDRGPFGKGRIIDLSYSAAKKIDMIGHGIAHVQVSVYIDSISPIQFEDIVLPKPYLLSISTKNS